MCIRDRLGTFLGNLVGLNGNSFTDKISMQNMTANAWLFIISVVLCMPVIPCLLYTSGNRCSFFCFCR